MSNLLTQLKEKSNQVNDLYDHILFAETWLTQNFDHLPEHLQLEGLKRLEVLYEQFADLTGVYHHEYKATPSSSLQASSTITKPRDEFAESTSGTYIDQYGSKITTLQEALDLFSH